jgi:hypothetical protein
MPADELPHGSSLIVVEHRRVKPGRRPDHRMGFRKREGPVAIGEGFAHGDDGVHPGAFGPEEDLAQVVREFRGTQVGVSVYEKAR